MVGNNMGTVSLVVIGPDIVNFEWTNGCVGPFAEQAHAFLRGSTFLLRVNNEDAKVEIAFELRECVDASRIIVTEAHGFLTGLTTSDDRCVDSHMLQHDAALRQRMTLEGWAGERTTTDFRCIDIVTEMLRTLRPGWSVAFDQTSPGADACPLLYSVLGSHITLLQEGGLTHMQTGARRMLYL